MIFAILIFVALVAIGFFTVCEWDWEETLQLLPIALVIAAGSFFCSGIIWSSSVDTVITVKEETIYSLETTTHVSGSFHLGYGTVSSGPVYYYYIENEDGTYTLNYCNASKSSLKLSDSESPKITITIEQTDTSKENWFWGTGKPWSLTNDYKETYLIIVPTDTIKENFNGMLN